MATKKQSAKKAANKPANKPAKKAAKKAPRKKAAPKKTAVELRLEQLESKVRNMAPFKLPAWAVAPKQDHSFGSVPQLPSFRGEACEVGDTVGPVRDSRGNVVSEDKAFTKMGQAYQRLVNQESVNVCAAIRAALGEGYTLDEDCKVTVDERTGVVMFTPVIRTRLPGF